MNGEPIRPDPKPVKREKKRKGLRPKRWGVSRSERGSSHRRRPRHIDHMLRVKAQPCAACLAFGPDPRCQRDEDGMNEAAHVGERKGYRADDLDVITLGAYHHRINGWDTYSGPFAGWSREQRRTWAAEQIGKARAAVPQLPAWEECL